MKTVLVGINTYPGHAFCRNEYLESINKMIEHTNIYMPDVVVDVLVVWNGNQSQWGFGKWEVINYEVPEGHTGMDILAAKQNILRDRTIERKYDYLFLSETDTLPVEDTLTAFIEFDQDIVASPYFVVSEQNAVIQVPVDNPKYAEFVQRGVTHTFINRHWSIPCVWGLFGDKSRMWEMSDLLPQRGFVRAISSGVGACLIKRQVLEEVGPFEVRVWDYSKGEKKLQKQFTDFIMNIRAFQLGFQMFVDTNRIANHLHYDFDHEQMLYKWFDPADNVFGLTDLEDNSFQARIDNGDISL